MDIAGAIGAVTAAIGFARELTNVEVQVDQASLKLKIADLTGALAEAKLGLIDVAEQLREKETEIERLRSFDVDLSKLLLKDGFYMDSFEDGSPRGDPYCRYCVEKKVGLFRLYQANKAGRPSTCPNCRTEFGHAPHYLYEKRER